MKTIKTPDKFVSEDGTFVVEIINGEVVLWETDGPDDISDPSKVLSVTPERSAEISLMLASGARAGGHKTQLGKKK